MKKSIINFLPLSKHYQRERIGVFDYLESLANIVKMGLVGAKRS